MSVCTCICSMHFTAWLRCGTHWVDLVKMVEWWCSCLCFVHLWLNITWKCLTEYVSLSWAIMTSNSHGFLLCPLYDGHVETIHSRFIFIITHIRIHWSSGIINLRKVNWKKSGTINWINLFIVLKEMRFIR